MDSLALLALASAALFVGPMSATVGTRVHALVALVDGFALALVAGLCLVFVLPHALEALGPWGLLPVAAGAGLPVLGHRLGRGRPGSLGLLAVALAMHAVVDGAVLSAGGPHTPLAWAVVAHRLPVGFALVVAAQGLRGRPWVPWGLALLVVLMTVIGYLVGPGLRAGLSSVGPAALEALVGGLLLHVVIGSHALPRPLIEQDGDARAERDPDERRQREGRDEHAAGHAHEPANGFAPWAAAGAVSGLLLMLAGAYLAAPSGLPSRTAAFLSTLGTLLAESAPALLLGYALAGVVPSLLTPARTASLGRGGKLAQALRGVAFGLPLPLCSCGVLPLYESLIRRGVPPVAAMAFFVATPELGLDAILLSVPLLGGSLTAARVLCAFVVALLVAWLVGGRPSMKGPGVEERVPPAAGESVWTRLRAGLRFGFVEVFDHTMPWIALGLVVAAMAEPMLSQGALATVPDVLQVPLAALVGVPIYVCASGATPVAALVVHKGLSAGAAIAFLIAGPATNVTTFGVLARLHGPGLAVRFGVSVTAVAVLAGWLVDLVGVRAIPLLEEPAAGHGPAWWAVLAVLGLAALTVASLIRQGPRGALRQILRPIHTH